MIRQGTGEALDLAVWLDTPEGAPLLGAPLTVLAWRKSDGQVVTPPVAVEVGGGFYRLAWATAPTVDVLVRVETAGRFVPLEVVVGGSWDRLDAAVTSRASAAAVTALGSPAQADALSALQAVVDALGSPAQAAALAGALTDLLAALVPLDAPVSSRAAPADLALLDVAVSTRATPDDLVCPEPIPPLGGTLT